MIDSQVDVDHHAHDGAAAPKKTKAAFYATLHENTRRYLRSTRDATANLSISAPLVLCAFLSSHPRMCWFPAGNIAALIYHDWRANFGEKR
jgi:hypothetical protein